MHARMRRASLIASVYFNPFDIHVFTAYHASSSIDSKAKGEKTKNEGRGVIPLYTFFKFLQFWFFYCILFHRIKFYRNIFSKLISKDKSNYESKWGPVIMTLYIYISYNDIIYILINIFAFSLYLWTYACDAMCLNRNSMLVSMIY